MFLLPLCGLVHVPAWMCVMATVSHTCAWLNEPTAESWCMPLISESSQQTRVQMERNHYTARAMCAGLAPGAWSIVGRAGSSQGDLAALWGPRQELAMQGSWENLATLLGNPLPLPLESLPSAGEQEGGPPPQTSSSSSMDRHLLVRPCSVLLSCLQL